MGQEPQRVVRREQGQAEKIAEERTGAQTAYINEHAAHKKTQEDMKLEAKKAEDLKKSIDKWTENSKSLQSQLENARNNNRKFEVDFAKIRTAVGELKLKEILG